MSHQHPLPMTPVEALDAALTVAKLAHLTAPTPLQRRKAMERIEELKREKAEVQRRHD